MFEIIAGNLCSIGAMITDSISGTRKKHSEILSLQILSMIFYGAGSLILKGYSAVAQNVVGIVRNLAAMKNVKSQLLEWVLIAAGVILGIVFNNRGILGWLPIIANLEYSIAVFRFQKDVKKLKIAFVINTFLFGTFNYVIYNFVGGISNTVVTITTLVSLFQEYRMKTWNQ